MSRFTRLRIATALSSPENVLQNTVQRVSERTGVNPNIVRVFAKLSDPTKADLFSAQAAHKAFAHLKAKPARCE